MREEQPLISVIIPVYNGERYLGAAIESVLAQSYRPIEIIVVDDGSTDGSAAIAKSFPVVNCLQRSHAGASQARNDGVRMARGAFLAFLDADDLWMPNKLARQMAYLKADPTIDMVFGQVEQFISPDLPPTRPPALPSQPVLAGLHAGALLILRNTFAKVGPFATNWTIGEFIDWYGRAQSLGLQSAVLPEVVMRRRIHTTNLTRRTVAHRSDYLKILKAHLDVKRVLTCSDVEAISLVAVEN